MKKVIGRGGVGMKKVIVDTPDDTTVRLSNLDYSAAIFARKREKLAGMVVEVEGAGWTLCLGGETRSCGYYATRVQCLRAAEGYGYEFFVEE